MPTITLRLDDKEHEALKKAAEASHLLLTAWARSELMKLALKAAPQAQPAKPYVKPGPKPMPDDEFLDRFASERFPSGQRRYRFVISSYPELADDEAAHAANEADILPYKGKPDSAIIRTRPKLWAYWEAFKKRDAAT